MARGMLADARARRNQAAVRAWRFATGG